MNKSTILYQATQAAFFLRLEAFTTQRACAKATKADMVEKVSICEARKSKWTVNGRFDPVLLLTLSQSVCDFSASNWFSALPWSNSFGCDAQRKRCHETDNSKDPVFPAEAVGNCCKGRDTESAWPRKGLHLHHSTLVSRQMETKLGMYTPAENLEAINRSDKHPPAIDTTTTAVAAYKVVQQHIVRHRPVPIVQKKC